MEKAKYKDVAIYFKNGLDHRQYKLIHQKCREIFSLCKVILHLYGFDAVVTSMIRPRNSIMGESNVHATGRAIDFVGKLRPGESSQKNLRLITIANKICGIVNMIYTRNDQKLTLIYHDAGGGKHFHCQIPWSKGFVDYDGVVPEAALKLGEADELEEVDYMNEKTPNTTLTGEKRPDYAVPAEIESAIEGMKQSVEKLSDEQRKEIEEVAALVSDHQKT